MKLPRVVAAFMWLLLLVLQLQDYEILPGRWHTLFMCVCVGVVSVNSNVCKFMWEFYFLAWQLRLENSVETYLITKSW